MGSRSRRPISSKQGSILRSGRLAPWLCKGITENSRLGGHMMVIGKKGIWDLDQVRVASCLTLISRRMGRRRMIRGRVRTRRVMQISTREAIAERVRMVVVEQLQEAYLEATLILRANKLFKTCREEASPVLSSTKIFHVVLADPTSKPLINREARCKWFIHLLKKHRKS